MAIHESFIRKLFFIRGILITIAIVTAKYLISIIE